MKKITILSLHLGYGGIERCVVTLANILCKKYEVEIATVYRLYEESAFFLDDKVKINYLNGNLKPNHSALRKAFQKKNIISIVKESIFALKVLFLRWKSIKTYLLNCDADVIISTRDIFNKWLGKYGKNNNIKIGWEHNHFHDNNSYANKICKSVKNLDYFVLVSSDLEKYYKNRLENTCKCFHIPNAVDSFPDKVSSLRKKRLVSVGRLSKEKGFIDLLEVFQKVLEKEPTCTLDIIGDGPERESLEKYIYSNKLEKNVKLHGFQGREYINSILHESSIYLMTSYTESFGIVLIEAMSHGIPCIAMDSAEGAREIIKDGENGYLISSRSMEDMANKIISLLNNSKERTSLGRNARKSVEKYKSENIGKMWFNLIEKGDIDD